MIRAKFLQTIFIAKRPPKNGWGGEFAVITACNALTGGDRDADAVETAKLRGFRFGLGGGFADRSGVLFIQSKNVLHFVTFEGLVLCENNHGSRDESPLVGSGEAGGQWRDYRGLEPRQTQGSPCSGRGAPASGVG